MIIDIKDEKILESMLETSEKQNVMLFKHSTICPISSNALIQFETVCSKRSSGLVIGYW